MSKNTCEYLIDESERIIDGFSYHPTNDNVFREEQTFSHENIVYDKKKDHAIRSFLERLSDMKKFEDKKGLLVFVKILMVEVSDFYGGLEKRFLEFRCLLSKLLKNRSPSNTVYLGEFKGCGICRHRAILFKIVCDQFEIPCRIIDGLCCSIDEDSGKISKEAHMWNEVILYKECITIDVSDFDLERYPCLNVVYSTHGNLIYKNCTKYFRDTGKQFAKVNIFMRDGKFAECREVAMKLYRYVEVQDEFVKEEKVMFDSLLIAGACDYELGKFSDSLIKLKKSMEIRKRMYTREKSDSDYLLVLFSQDMAQVLSKIGNVLEKQEKIDFAIAYIRKAIVYWKKVIPQTTVIIIGITNDLHCLGRLLRKKKEFDKSSEVLWECMKYRMKTFGAYDIDVGKTYLELGKTAKDAKKYEEAKVYLSAGNEVFTSPNYKNYKNLSRSEIYLLLEINVMLGEIEKTNVIYCNNNFRK